MTLLITGATGPLGRLVVEQLLAAGVPAGDIIATGRATEKIKDLAERGVAVRALEFGDAAAVRAAVAGADRVLVFRLDLFAGQRRLAVRGAHGERGGENESE